MKLKFTLMAVAAAMAVSYQAQAGVTSVSTNHAALTVALTVSTNAQETSSGDKFREGAKKVKIDTKDLLDLFAAWDGADRTIEPWKSARLVLAYDQPWNGDVVVVDKTGTNVLFDANDTVDDFFVVNFFADIGIETFSGIDAAPGHFSATEMNTGNWTLVDNGVVLVSTFLGDDDGGGGIGGATVNFTQTFDATDAFKNWNASETLNTPEEEGDQTFMGRGASAGGSIKATGHGVGSNLYLWNRLAL